MAVGQLRVSRHPALAGLEAVCGVGVAADIVRHAHGSLVVGVCLDGGRRIVAGGGQWLAGPGMGFVIPPGVAHACAPLDAGGHSYVVLSAAPSCFAQARRLGLDGEVWPRLWHDGGAATLVLAVAEAVAQGDPCALAAFADLARRLDLRPGTCIPLHPATLRAKAVIDAAPDQSVRVAELARLAGVSPFHLERLFVRDLGVPLGEYALSRRVSLAAAHIRAGEGLAQAALAAGFYDQSHLNRHFRRRMGVPPGQYVAVPPGNRLAPARTGEDGGITIPAGPRPAR